MSWSRNSGYVSSVLGNHGFTILFRCQSPVSEGLNETSDLGCRHHATRYTDDLGSVHYLCDGHCAEALESNDFGHEPL